MRGCRVVLQRETWDFNPDWLAFVKRVWDGGHRVLQQSGDDPSLRAFAEKASASFTRLNVPFSHIKTWVSVQVPVDGDGYDEGYPHFHYPLNGTTLVHYLDPGDKPAPLHIFEGDDVIEEIFPVRGLTVFMPNDLKHGVLKNHGTTDRIQMIATALR